MNKFQSNFNQNSKIFIRENALENVVCEMASILSQPQHDNQPLRVATHMYNSTSITQLFWPSSWSTRPEKSPMCSNVFQGLTARSKSHQISTLFCVVKQPKRLWVKYGIIYYISYCLILNPEDCSYHAIADNQGSFCVCAQPMRDDVTM